MPDTKELSPIVKYVVAATGFRQREAWELLQRVSEEHYTRIDLAARHWDGTPACDQPIEQKANHQLREIVGSERLMRLIAAARAANGTAAGM